MLRVAIVDDHALLRNSLNLMISSFDGIVVKFEAENGNDLLKKLEKEALDLVLLDVQMPEMDGFQTCLVLNHLYPSLKILMLSQLKDKNTIQKSLECGAHGYLTKNADSDQLQKAIFGLYKNEFYFDTEIAEALHDIILDDKKHPRPDNPFSDITEREFQLIRMVATGLTNVEVGEKLFINVRTVEAHRKRIMEKVAVKSFNNVILQALKFHYLSVEDL